MVVPDTNLSVLCPSYISQASPHTAKEKNLISASCENLGNAFGPRWPDQKIKMLLVETTIWLLGGVPLAHTLSLCRLKLVKTCLREPKNLSGQRILQFKCKQSA